MKILQQRPLLPSADKIEPYLRRIDENRYYSNSGPLVLEFEKRLSGKFGAPCITTISCTSGLTACLLALNLPERSFVACPSWTFVATAAAIVAAGHIPYFVDVSNSWIANFNRNIKISASIIVSPFGCPVDITTCDFLAEDSGCKIIIDAAAGFDSASAGKCPVVVSTHATKTFGTGEGGFVMCRDEDLLASIRSICNFGLPSVGYAGINGKMSEYAAAVGLAELDGWEAKRMKWLGVKSAYMEAFADYETPVFDLRWASNVFPICVPNAAQVVERMGMGRTWTPVHRMKAYEKYPRTSMEVTDKIAETTLLLPFSIDQTNEEIAYIKERLVEAL